VLVYCDVISGHVTRQVLRVYRRRCRHVVVLWCLPGVLWGRQYVRCASRSNQWCFALWSTVYGRRSHYSQSVSQCSRMRTRTSHATTYTV